MRQHAIQEEATANAGSSYDKEAFLVRFGEGDPKNPMNFSAGRKALLTLEMGLLALTGTVGSSIITPAESAISAYLDTSVEATVLTLSLFVLGTLSNLMSTISCFSSPLFSFLLPLPPGLLFDLQCSCYFDLQAMPSAHYSGRPSARYMAAAGQYYPAFLLWDS